jgi:MFS superfamily sulfate permease-like transporter
MPPLPSPALARTLPAMLAVPLAIPLAVLSTVSALPGAPAARVVASLVDPVAGKTRLRFGADGAFKLVVFNDLHYGEVRLLACI